MSFDTITIGLLGLLVGMTIQPYVHLGFEFWLTRPRRITPTDYFDHCGPECSIR